MSRLFLIFALLLPALALAGDAGIGPEVRAAAGLGRATQLDGTDGWQAPITGVDGGFVRVIRYADAAAAHAGWSFATQASATAVLPPLSGFADEAVGDGATFVIARDGDRVITLRDPSGHAAAVWAALHRP